MFDVKDSGAREKYAGGMQRDTAKDKTRYDLVFDGPMLRRWAEHLTKGAIKYEPRNWMKASGQKEADRFRESAVRHFAQWLRGETDEDHASAVFFNINGLEYVHQSMDTPMAGDNVLDAVPVEPLRETTPGPMPQLSEKLYRAIRWHVTNDFENDDAGNQHLKNCKLVSEDEYKMFLWMRAGRADG